MRIIQKLKAKAENMYGAPPVTIAFLGDSVTQGCFECYKKGNTIDTVFDGASGYSARLREMLQLIYPNVQLNVINAGISGDTAEGGEKRFARDVAPYSPDLVVVGFALNDSTRGEAGLPSYICALESIFAQCKKIGAEIICLTPNMMNTKVSCHLCDKDFIGLAESLSALQSGGVLDKYVQAAKETAQRAGAAVCDIYGQWKKLERGGADVTELLANKLNHPVRELHYYTAIKLIESMFEGE